MYYTVICFFFSSRRRHTRCALVTGVQPFALPISRRPLGLEVYSIDSVRKASRDAQQMTVNEFLPFFSIRHGPHGDDDGCFWYAQRKPSLRRDDDGSEMSITLVDRDMNPRVPSVDTLSIGLTCTNRDRKSTRLNSST